MKRWLLYVGIIAVLGWGIWLRCFALGQTSYWLDEGYSVTIANAIVRHGYPLMDSGNFIWRAPLYHYLLAGVVLLAGDGEFATRLLSVVIGLVGIVVLTYCAKRWFNEGVAIVTLILTSFSVWEITWSRQARMYILLQLLFWLAVAVYERWTQTRKQFWIVVIVVLAAIATHQFALLLIVILPAYSAVQRWYQQTNLMIGYSLLLIAFVLVVTIVLRYAFYQPIPVNYLVHYLDFLWRNHAVTLILAGFGIVIGLRQRAAMITWLVSVGFVGLGIVSFSITLLQYRYLFFLYPIIIWLASITFVWLGQQRHRVVGLVLIVSCSALLMWHGELTVIPKEYWPLESDASTNPFPYKSITPQPDFRSAYQFIAQQNAAMIITPYPELTRLYLKRDDSYALYLDLIGTNTLPTITRQLYTGVSYITLAQLKLARAQHGLVLLDTLAQHRIPTTLRSYITAHAQVVYEHSTGDWSNIIIYQLQE